MSGTGGDADGNAGSFLSPAYPRYLHHIRGGKPIPPTQTLVWHVGALVCTEQEAPCHCPVNQGDGKEVQASGVGGAVREFGEGLPDLWGTIGDLDVV